MAESKNKKHNLTVRFTAEELEILNHEAKLQNRPLANLIYKIVCEYIQLLQNQSKDQ